MPRMADSGWLMIGVENSSPKMPELVSVKVDPPTSSGESFLVRARSASSAMVRARSAKLRCVGQPDYGHDEAPIESHGDTEMDVLVVADGEALRGAFKRSIDDGETLERLDGRGGDEGHVGELCGVALLERGFLAVAQARDARHVDFVDGVDVWADTHALDHALGNDGAHAGERDQFAGLSAAVRRTLGRRSAAGGGWLRVRSTSSLPMRPSAPEPATWLRSRPCSLAMRRASGEERMRPVNATEAAATWADPFACGGGTWAGADFWTTCGGADSWMGVVEEPAAPAPSITATTVFTCTVSPSANRISLSTPATGAGISASTLSVEISKSGSSFRTVSPVFLSHLVMVPSKIDSPIWGMMTSVGMRLSFAVPDCAAPAWAIC